MNREKSRELEIDVWIDTQTVKHPGERMKTK